MKLSEMAAQRKVEDRVPADEELRNSTIIFYVDERNNQLKVKVKENEKTTKDNNTRRV